jgi:hypothetical protein
MARASSSANAVASIALVALVGNVGFVRASSTTASAGAEVVSPAFVNAAAVTQLLFSPSPGVLTISIPGAAGSGGTSPASGEAGAPGSGFAAPGTAADGSLDPAALAALVVSDGTLAGGQGVSLALASLGDDQVAFTVAYN